ncbi:MAG: pyroglutamyl-peptidase I [Planctomycetales bacterium]|nr:pyroglutamyl-peptidase I [bacterium]UNM07203.1 MAG: pyroglutamyl-peptidase I [Planctomycetales bacterium]
MRILVTGFEPFGKLVDNPSQRLLGQLSAADFAEGAELHSVRLPTSYRGSETLIRELLDEIRPDLCVCLGVAQNRRAVCLERIAVNMDDCSLADNDGELAKGREIVPGAALAIQSVLDLAGVVEQDGADEGAGQGLPLSISNHAGNFVCNHVYYAALQHIAEHGLPTKCVFIHVPMTEECRGPGERYDWQLPSQAELHGRVAGVASRLAQSIQAQPDRLLVEDGD